MDILLQYLNVRAQKQAYIKITDVPCCSVFQSMHHEFGLDLPYKALKLMDYLEQAYRSTFMLTGIIDAKYCYRMTLVQFSYVDFCQLTCGPGETSGID